MVSETGQHGASGESALLKFFLPGLVVGTVLGSMLGLFVGTRSGSVVLPDVKPGPAVAGAPVRDDRIPEPAETAPAEKPADPAPAEEKPAEKPEEKPAGGTP